MMMLMRRCDDDDDDDSVISETVCRQSVKSERIPDSVYSLQSRVPTRNNNQSVCQLSVS